MSYLIGIDIGGTNLRAAVISEEGAIAEIFKVENEVKKGPTYNLDKLINQINTEWNKYEFKKIGVGAPGSLGFKVGKLLNPVNLKGWENFNLK